MYDWLLRVASVESFPTHRALRVVLSDDEVAVCAFMDGISGERDLPPSSYADPARGAGRAPVSALHGWTYRLKRRGIAG
jgi:hypothetical protein